MPLLSVPVEVVQEMLAEHPEGAPYPADELAHASADPDMSSSSYRARLFMERRRAFRQELEDEALAAQGVDNALEVGPGAVLKGLVRRIDRSIKVATCGTLDEIHGLVEA